MNSIIFCKNIYHISFVLYPLKGEKQKQDKTKGMINIL